MEAKNIDDVLVKAMSEQGNSEPQPQVDVVERPVEPVQSEQVTPSDETTAQLQDAQEQQNEPSETDTKEVTDSKEKVEKQNNSPIDEYGNPVEKPRLYTEEELNQRIRERLSRGKYAEQQNTNQTQPQSQPASEEVTDEDWRVQLRKEIRHEMTQAQQEEQQRQWQHHESMKQAQFEEKFTAGMSKYQDFQQVVAGKPITDTMMIAARDLENPAAFVYAASKLHPQELARISQISNTLAQATEVGRLHERMVKERKGASSAPKPIEPPKGDLPSKVISNQPSIDERINNYARQKRK